MLRKIHHVGIVVRSLDEAYAFYRDTLGLHVHKEAVVEDQGVTHMAAMCAICKAQFTKIMPYYGYDREMVVSVHQLVGDAILLGNND